MEDSINIFGENSNETFKMPSQDINTNEELRSENIDRLILGETVKTLNIKETDNIADVNYIIDFSKIKSIQPIQKDVLKSLISPVGGDVTIYLYNESKLISVGLGESSNLAKMMPLIQKYVFNEQVQIFKNYKVGEKPVLVQGKSISELRLNL